MNYRENIHIVLVRPKHPGNIGSAARAMNNMGFTKLVLVDPAPYDVPETWMMGWNSEEIIKKAKVYPSLREALKGYHFILGTTRRKGRGRGNMYPLADVMDDVAAISKNNRVAIVFGNESSGLSNEELAECHKLCYIDAYPRFASLNLAQAVMVVCYEAHKKLKKNKNPLPLKLAGKEETDMMYAHVDSTLRRLGYESKGSKALKKQIMKRIRSLFSRAKMDKRDVQMIRGLCRQVEKMNDDSIF